jgi:hypothetical protein
VFLAAARALEELQTFMEEIDKESLLRLIQTYASGSFMAGARLVLMRLGMPGAAEKEITQHDSLLSANDKLGFAERFEKMGLPFSAKLLRQWATGTGGLPKSEILLPELQRRIEDEIQSVLWLYVPREKSKFYRGSAAFGAEVAAAFPSTSYDIEEAGKCFALNRYTACSFHLMRVIEVGLRSLGKALNDPDLDPKKNPSWERLLGKCDKELRKPLQERSQEWKTDELFFSTSTANLRAIKDAWRNPTLHVERSYHEEEAQEVYSAIRSFMRHLATKLAE